MSFKTTFSDLVDRFNSLKIQKVRQGDRSFDISLSDGEIFDDLQLHRGNDRLLGRYSVEEVSKALEEYDVWKILHARGYHSPRLVIHSMDPFRQRIRILTTPEANEEEHNLLCEMRVFDAWLHGPCPVTGKKFEVDALVIDWLLFQNPALEFSADRPPLPGQRYPGLGILRICMRAIIDLAKGIGKEAVVNIPEYYHNAVLYHSAFRFFSPYVEGRFLALKEFLKDKNLAGASNAVAGLQIMNLTKNEVFVWKPHEQILGLVPKIQRYFELPGYHEKVQLANSESKFAFLNPRGN